MSPALSPNEDQFTPAAVPLDVSPSEERRETADGYIALKYTFFTPKRGELCGAFCLIFEGETGETLFQALWVTRSDSLANLSTSQDWRTFNRLVPRLGPYDKAWGDKLTPLLSELLPASDRIELYETGPDDKARVLSRITGTLRKGCERVTHYFLDTSCDFEALNREELVEVGILKDDSNSDEKAPSDPDFGEDGKSFSGLLIQCLPLVDPVHGKAVSDLVPGDILEVQIQSSVGAGGLVQQYLRATKQSPSFPVESVEKHDEKTYVYLAINEEMRGLLTLTKNLRLKTKRTALTGQGEPLVLDNLVFFLSLGLALAGFILAIRYLF